MAFTKAGIALGAGCVVAPMRPSAGGRETHDLSGEDRILALLSAAFGRSINPGIIGKLQHAAEIWSRGDPCLASIYLAQLRIPRLDQEHQAWSLFLADRLIQSGYAPRDLAKALGFELSENVRKFDSDQPRDDHGRWTSGGGSGAAGGDGSAGPVAEGRSVSAPLTIGGGSGSTASETNPKPPSSDLPPPIKHVERVKVRIAGGTASDANPSSIEPGAQYAQSSVTPILTSRKLKHILDRHRFGRPDPEAGEFLPEFSTKDAIKSLIADAWTRATPMDIIPGNDTDTAMVIAVKAFHRYETTDGPPVDEPIIVGRSGKRSDGTPSVPTDTYVMILDSNMHVRTLYPINPNDPEIDIHED